MAADQPENRDLEIALKQVKKNTGAETSGGAIFGAIIAGVAAFFLGAKKSTVALVAGAGAALYGALFNADARKWNEKIDNIVNTTPGTQLHDSMVKKVKSPPQAALAAGVIGGGAVGGILAHDFAKGPGKTAIVTGSVVLGAVLVGSLAHTVSKSWNRKIDDVLEASEKKRSMVQMVEQQRTIASQVSESGRGA